MKNIKIKNVLIILSLAISIIGLKPSTALASGINITDKLTTTEAVVAPVVQKKGSGKYNSEPSGKEYTQLEEDLKLVNWTTVDKSVYHNQAYLKAKTGGFLTVTFREASSQQIWYKSYYDDDSYDWDYYIKSSPGIMVDLAYSSTNNDYRKNTRYPKYDWRVISGDPTGVNHGKYWETPKKTTSLIYTKVGEYKFSATAYREWDQYIRDNYKAVVCRIDYTGAMLNKIDTEYRVVDKFVKVAGAEDMTKIKYFNAKVAVQDLNKNVPMSSTTELKDADVKVNIVQ